MRELIKNVAQVINDLQTLNLVSVINTSTIHIDDKTKKYILTVQIVASEYAARVCLDMLQELQNTEGYVMNVEERSSHHLTGRSILVVEFYEP